MQTQNNKLNGTGVCMPSICCRMTATMMTLIAKIAMNLQPRSNSQILTMSGVPQPCNAYAKAKLTGL